MKKHYTQTLVVNYPELDNMVQLNKVTIISKDAGDTSPLIVDSFFISTDGVKWVRKLYASKGSGMFKKRAYSIKIHTSSLEGMLKIYEQRKRCKMVYVYGIKDMRAYVDFVNYSTFIHEGSYLVKIMPDKRGICTNEIIFKYKGDGRVDAEMSFEYYDKKTNKWIVCGDCTDANYLNWVHSQNWHNDVYGDLFNALGGVCTVEDAIEFIREYIRYDRVMLMVDL